MRHGPGNIEIINEHVEQNIINMYPRTKTNKWKKFYKEIVSTPKKQCKIII